MNWTSEKPTVAGWRVCIECGMDCNAGEYHPYAACLMFKQCRNSETVRANLQAVRADSYQQGRRAGHIEGLREAVQYRCFYCSQTHLWLPVDHEGWHATERQGIKTHCNAWPIHQRIAVLAQQAQEGGVGDGGHIANK